MEETPMMRQLAIGGAVVATVVLFAVPTSSFSAENKKPKEIVVVGSTAKKGGGQNAMSLQDSSGETKGAGAKKLEAEPRSKRGGAIRTFNLQDNFPQK
jgi:hypothetical protein